MMKMHFGMTGLPPNASLIGTKPDSNAQLLGTKSQTVIGLSRARSDGNQAWLEPDLNGTGPHWNTRRQVCTRPDWSQTSLESDGITAI